MSDKILEVEHRPGEEIVVHLRPPKLGPVGNAAKEHLLTARKEMLLAIRGVIDAAIKYTETEEKAKGKGRKKIEVQ